MENYNDNKSVNHESSEHGKRKKRKKKKEKRKEKKRVLFDSKLEGFHQALEKGLWESDEFLGVDFNHEDNKFEILQAQFWKLRVETPRRQRSKQGKVTLERGDRDTPLTGLW